jgi:hypothetical protein
MIKVKISISTNRWFDNQKQCAEWLGIVNTSKGAIQARCRVLSFEVEFD